MAGIIRRRIQLSRGPAQSRLSGGGRTVEREILDELEPSDPRAARSRGDLRRVNRVLGSCGILARSLPRTRALPRSAAPLRVLEIGAGDGSLALRLARRLAGRWPAAELTLLDRQALVSPATGTAFAQLGWTLRPLMVDVLEWARAPMRQQPPGRWDIILANLFLHHFEDARLRELLAAIAARCDTFVACEPRRGRFALLGAQLLPAIGVSRDTRHDAIVSVRAGFRGSELSRLWPAVPSGWRLEERPAGPFSHLFVAVRAEAIS